MISEELWNNMQKFEAENQAFRSSTLQLWDWETIASCAEEHKPPVYNNLSVAGVFEVGKCQVSDLGIAYRNSKRLFKTLSSTMYIYHQ